MNTTRLLSTCALCALAAFPPTGAHAADRDPFARASTIRDIAVVLDARPDDRSFLTATEEAMMRWPESAPTIARAAARLRPHLGSALNRSELRAQGGAIGPEAAGFAEPGQIRMTVAPAPAPVPVAPLTVPASASGTMPEPAMDTTTEAQASPSVPDPTPVAGSIPPQPVEIITAIRTARDLRDLALVLSRAAADEQLFLDAVAEALTAWAGSTRETSMIAVRLRPDLEDGIVSLAVAHGPREAGTAVAGQANALPATSLAVAGGAALVAGAGAGVALALALDSDEDRQAEAPISPTVPATPSEPARPSNPTTPTTPVTPTDPLSKIPATVPYLSDPESFRTDEFRAAAGIGAVGAEHAWARGSEGRGVKVAIIDDGLDLNNAEFSGRVGAGAWDLVDMDALPQAGGDHGTHVAGTIGAARNDAGVVGVAPGATLIPFRAFGPDGSVVGGETTLAEAFDRARAAGARVVNNSWALSVPVGAFTRDQAGATFPKLVEAIRSGVEGGQVLVFATGNDGFSDTGIVAGLPKLFPELRGGVLAVGAIDADGKIAPFSNRCGSAAEWCLVAPGVDVASVLPGGGTQRLSGTSMAAPHVTGAVAVLLELFPFLTPQEIADILLRTAKDLGAPGTDGVYGRGLLDLEKATNPVGEATVPTGASVVGPATSLAGTVLASGPAFGAALTKAPLQAVFLDGYGRSYAVDLARFAVEAGRPADTEKLLRRYLASRVTVDLAQGARLMLAPPDDRAGDRPDKAGGAFLMETQVGRFGAFAGHDDLRSGSSASLAGVADTAAEVDPGSLANPFLALIEDGMAATWRLGIGGSWMLGGGIHAGETASGTSASAATLDGEWRTGRTVAQATVGLVSERGSLLGTRGLGALDTGGRTTTAFASLAGSVPVAERLDLFAHVHAGTIDMAAGTAGLLRGFSGLAAAAGAGMSIRDAVAVGDKLSFSVVQPLRVEAGSLSLDMPVGRTIEGGITRRAIDIDAEPGSREMDFRVSWTMDFGAENAVAVGMEHRMNPNHSGRPANETVGVIRYIKRF